MVSEGYQLVDVISFQLDYLDCVMLCQKFFDEYIYSEDEVCFFVVGVGQFILYFNGKVYEVLCEQGDLIGVFDGMLYWFDMSELFYFVVICLFINKEGWVVNFIGIDIVMCFLCMMLYISVCC